MIGFNISDIAKFDELLEPVMPRVSTVVGCLAVVAYTAATVYNYYCMEQKFKLSGRDRRALEREWDQTNEDARLIPTRLGKY